MGGVAAGRGAVTTTLLAVYGTLRLPHVRQRLGVDARLRARGPCVLPGRLYALGRYPGLVPDPDGAVAGELLAAADDAVLAPLDRYEGHVPGAPGDSLFQRERLTLRDPAVTAWVYVYPHPVPGGALVASGDWLAESR